MTGSTPRNYKTNPTKEYIEKKGLILKMRAEKMSYEAIGKVLNISKQRVHQVLKDYSSIGGNIAPGEYECVVCKTQENLQCHHKNFDSYDNRPSNLEWRCLKHHKEVHKGRERDNRFGDEQMGVGKFIGFRIQELDFELLRKQAIKQDLPVSTIIRRVLKSWLKKEISKLKGGENK